LSVPFLGEGEITRKSMAQDMGLSYDEGTLKELMDMGFKKD
jgi:hypothetical protein